MSYFFGHAWNNFLPKKKMILLRAIFFLSQKSMSFVRKLLAPFFPPPPSLQKKTYFAQKKPFFSSWKRFFYECDTNINKNMLKWYPGYRVISSRDEHGFKAMRSYGKYYHFTLALMNLVSSMKGCTDRILLHFGITPLHFSPFTSSPKHLLCIKMYQNCSQFPFFSTQLSSRKWSLHRCAIPVIRRATSCF